MRKIIIPMLFAAPMTAGAQDTTRVETVVADTSVSVAPVPAEWNPSNVYKMKNAVDIPLTVIGTGWTLYGFSQIYSKDRTSEEKILSLDKNNVPKIDRHGTEIFHPKASDAADMIFYSAMPLPLFLMLDKSIRKDAFKTAYLYLEAMAVTGVLYTSAAYFGSRFRPYAYNPEVPMDKRTRGGAKNSFFAGHVALVGTSTFFMAKMLNDHHPEWKCRWVPFAAAGVITGTVGYLRRRGGEHFITDVALGSLVGTLSGILVPHFHKNKNLEDRRVSFTAGYLFNTPQFGMVYKIR